VPPKANLRRAIAAALMFGLAAACTSAPATTRAPGSASAPPSSAGSSSPTALPSVEPSPSSASTSLTWEPIGSLPASGVLSVVGFDEGYVAITGARTAWFSPDGKGWTSSTLPFTETTDAQGRQLDARVDAMATDGSTLVAVGGYGHEPCTGDPADTGGGPLCPMAPLSWTSTDGRTWTSGLPGPRPPDPPGYHHGGEFTSIWPTAAGWDAAYSLWEGEMIAGRDFYRSPDGLAWTRMDPAPASGGTAIPEIRGGIADPSGAELIWQTSYQYTADSAIPTTTLSKSTGGGAWTAVDGFPGEGFVVDAAVVPAEGGPGAWVLAGSEPTGVDDLRPVMLTSDDLGRWRSTPLPGATDPGSGDLVRSMARDDGRIVAVALLYDGLAASQTTWVTTDGVSWIVAQADPAAGGFGPNLLADGPAGLIGIGPRPTDESAVWLAR
jgi:hypothetical protein